ncbi:unnamed protein product [Didymodactylos carnosus]|uniref:F-box domain-containing protein n=1 Tax=Didymodactylos carnosus TaxID=1234261 RepID=A0A8S2SJY7_9BILA|nr:unnamed protein product [Didymodactylos carnosus]CAF4225197.1 unnamed protein product [Didymodactylos carnosus]
MSTLETIPNELVFDIFKYLDPLHVLYSFSNLNYRFNKLLYSYEMYLSFTSSTINENIFRQVFAMPHIRSNVHSLILTNEKQIQSFSKTIVRKLDNLFPYIECLKIKNLRNLTNLKDLFNFSLNYLINLELYVFNISTIIEYIHFTRNSFPSLKYLSIFCKDENTPLVNNEQWNSKLVKQSLEKLDTFHFRIQFIKPTITIEQILEPFQEQFWIIDKKWIVKCDYNLDNSQYVLYTIPYGFRLMSTVTYDILETRSTLKEQVSLFILFFFTKFA